MTGNVKGLDLHNKGTDFMSRSNLMLVALIGTMTLSACNRQNVESSTSASSVTSKMSSLIKEHQFEEAAQLGLHGLKGNSSDATIYYLMSLAYAERAHYEAGMRGDSLTLVDQYSQQSIATDPSNQLNRFNVAWVLGYAGDIDDRFHCKRYENAHHLLSEIARDQSADAVLKNQVALSSAHLKEKSQNAHCPATAVPSP
jgi:hypothetical protein